MHLSEVEAFVSISSSNSMSSAARRLGLLPMTISRRLNSLEDELGVRLVQRTTRSITLTAEGELFLPYAQTMLDAEAEAKATIRNCIGTANGPLRITAPTVFGNNVILPIIPKLLDENPGLQIDLTLSDNIIDIVGLGIDIAIRIAPLRDSSLIAYPLASNPRMLCASPQYLKEMTIPTILDHLEQHQCIGLHGMPYWPFTKKNGESYVVRTNARFSGNSVDAVKSAAKLGLGIVMLSYWDVRSDILDGNLQVIILKDAEPESLSITALLPSRQHIPLRIKVFLDQLKEILGSVDISSIEFTR